MGSLTHIHQKKKKKKKEPLGQHMLLYLIEDVVLLFYRIHINYTIWIYENLNYKYKMYWASV